jgi:hypothetical protein
VTPNLGLRLVWDRYAVATTNAGIKSNANANVMTLGAVYQF